jgi:hypothetical protein
VPKPLYRYRQRTGSISEYCEAHRAEILHQVVSMHANLYQERFADVLVEMDAQIQQLRAPMSARK